MADTTQCLSDKGKAELSNNSKEEKPARQGHAGRCALRKGDNNLELCGQLIYGKWGAVSEALWAPCGLMQRGSGAQACPFLVLGPRVTTVEAR